METWAKVTLSVIGAALLTVSQTYSAHPDAPLMAYVAGGAGAVGMYLVGLYQVRPGNGGK